MSKIAINTLEDLDLVDKKVFMRVDFNVPLHGTHIEDDTRIAAALQSIAYILPKASLLVLASHLGRPQDCYDERFSLQPVAERLSQLLQHDVSFLCDYHEGNISQLATQMKESKIILLENLRFYGGEKKNSEEFATRLAKGFDVYVNEAFGTLHRKHSSVVGITKHFNHTARGIGFLVAKEVQTLEKATLQPERPFVFITGGAKVGDKIAVILSMLKRCNQVIIGGGMAYSFLRYKGYAVGKSLVDTRKDLIASIYNTAAERNVEILLPLDHVAAKDFSAQAHPVYLDSPDIETDLMGLDIGEKTIACYRQAITRAKTILWNGPMGVFEWPSFSHGTREIAEACRDNDGMTIVGGGDSIAAIKSFGLTAGFSHISTGGGASLKFLEGEQLVGLKALSKEEI